MSESRDAVNAQQLWFTAPRQVELREQKLQAGRDQLLVRSLCSAVSAGTEMLVYRGQVPPDMALDSSLSSLEGDASYPFQYGYACVGIVEAVGDEANAGWLDRSEEHTSELQSRENLVCRLLLEKKKKPLTAQPTAPPHYGAASRAPSHTRAGAGMHRQ